MCVATIARHNAAVTFSLDRLMYSTFRRRGKLLQCPSLNDYHANHKLQNRHKANNMLFTKMSISNVNVILFHFEILNFFPLC